jgi:hypothetical protein
MTAATVGRTPARWKLPRLHGLPWVTWRQHRMAVAGIAVLLGGVSVFMLINGLSMHRAYYDAGLNTCLGTPRCQTAYENFTHNYQTWVQYLPRFLTFLPMVSGVFLGAPLIAREIETGTFRFAWTQGRSRVQWITVKLVLLSIVLCGLALAFSAVFDWWYGPWHLLSGRMRGGEAYENEGLVFAGRTVFAFTLGALLGLLIRRAVPAMAATAAVWVAVVWPSVIYLRPLIMSPIVAPDRADLNTRQADVTDSWTQSASGHHLSQNEFNNLTNQARRDNVTSPQQMDNWLARHHYTNWISYQPGNRFWHFQLVEASGYLLVSLLLAGATIWWLHRRVS